MVDCGKEVVSDRLGFPGVRDCFRPSVCDRPVIETLPVADIFLERCRFRLRRAASRFEERLCDLETFEFRVVDFFIPGDAFLEADSPLSWSETMLTVMSVSYTARTYQPQHAAGAATSLLHLGQSGGESGSPQ